jgi:hypothetical protein
VSDDLREVELPDTKGVPRWLLLQQEIDYRLWLLARLSNETPKSPLDQMIDRATGHDEMLAADAAELMAELRWLRAAFVEAAGVAS